MSTANKNAQAEMRNREAMLVKRHDDDLADLMRTASGRRFVQRWLDEAGLTKSTIGPDALSMAWREGRRDFAIALAAECERVAPEEFLLMQREVFEERKTTAALDALAQEQARKEENQ